MSIEVPLAELVEAVSPYPWGYLLAVSSDGQARVLSVPTDYRDGRFHLEAGARTVAAAVANPSVTIVLPPSDGRRYSLIVDGIATVDEGAQPGGTIRVTPQRAVLHRPALSYGSVGA
jgi:hypothetical protein